MFNFGPGEIAILVLLGLLFLGPKRLPYIGEGLREQVRSFQHGAPLDPAQRWTRSDWVAVGGTLLVGSFALALTIASN